MREKMTLLKTSTTAEIKKNIKKGATHPLPKTKYKTGSRSAQVTVAVAKSVNNAKKL